MKNAAVDAVVETVTEKSSWFTPKRLIITAVVALGVAGTVFLLKKGVNAIEGSDEEYLEGGNAVEVPVAKKAEPKSTTK